MTHVIQAEFPPFNLTEDDGAAIAGAILAVWAAAWGFRTLIRVLKHTDGSSSTSESET